ncbi:MAG TPA: hypothetical protein VLC52_00015, partial [Anaerolineae bacterium]|nr:hypothetical protein [Anaerolineae bacterium]
DNPAAAPDASCLAEMHAPEFLVPQDMVLSPAIYRLSVDLAVALNPLRLGLLGLCTLCMVAPLTTLRRPRRHPLVPGDLFARLTKAVSLAIAALYLAFAAALAWAASTVAANNYTMLGFGLPVEMAPLFWLPRLAALLTLGLPILALGAWQRGSWSWRLRWDHLLFSVASLVMVGLMSYWRFLTWPW